MFCSTIIPTVNRSTLERTVRSVLGQSLENDDFEIVVVNDSGQELPEAGWQRSDRVRIITTQHRERSLARNAGAAIARGQFLHFLDDDDWLLPGALATFREMAHKSNAVWLYGSTQVVDREGNALIRLRHAMSGNCFIQVMAGEWIPLQASLIRADAFFRVGGFNPRLTGPEDIDLARRIALHGDFACTASVVACIAMGLDNSTTDYVRSVGESRSAREEILDAPAAFTRMRASANSGYWHGRIARAYLTSAVWNVRQKRLFTAASRLVYGLAGVAVGARYLVSPGYWQALARSYDSETFVREYRQAHRPILRRVARKTAKPNGVHFQR